MIIAIDMDNVLCDLQGYILEVYNSKYNTKYVKDDFKEFDIASTIGFENAAKMRNIYSDPEIYNFISPIKGTANALQKLINAGHQIYIVTDAIPGTFDRKIEWIKHYFSFIDEGHIISMKHKWLFKCDAMIEDNMENLLSGHHYERICIDHPWNRYVHDEAYSIHRCYSWNDVLNAINKINEDVY